MSDIFYYFGYQLYLKEQRRPGNKCLLVLNAAIKRCISFAIDHLRRADVQHKAFYQKLIPILVGI